MSRGPTRADRVHINRFGRRATCSSHGIVAPGEAPPTSFAGFRPDSFHGHSSAGGREGEFTFEGFCRQKDANRYLGGGMAGWGLDLQDPSQLPAQAQAELAAAQAVSFLPPAGWAPGQPFTRCSLQYFDERGRPIVRNSVYNATSTLQMEAADVQVAREESAFYDGWCQQANEIEVLALLALDDAGLMRTPEGEYLSPSAGVGEFVSDTVRGSDGTAAGGRGCGWVEKLQSVRYGLSEHDSMESYGAGVNSSITRRAAAGVHSPTLPRSTLARALGVRQPRCLRHPRRRGAVRRADCGARRPHWRRSRCADGARGGAQRLRGD